MALIEGETMDLLGAGEVCRLLGVAHRTLANWVEAGIVLPHVPGEGTGHHRQFKVWPDVGTIFIAKALKASGLTLDAAGNMLDVLRRFSEKRLRAAFAEGRTCLMAVGDDVVPTLVHPDSILSNPRIDYAAAAVAGKLPVAVDVQRAFDALMARVEALRQEKAAAPDPGERRVARC